MYNEFVELSALEVDHGQKESVDLKRIIEDYPYQQDLFDWLKRFCFKKFEKITDEQVKMCYLTICESDYLGTKKNLVIYMAEAISRLVSPDRVHTSVVNPSQIIKDNRVDQIFVNLADNYSVSDEANVLSFEAIDRRRNNIKKTLLKGRYQLTIGDSIVVFCRTDQEKNVRR